MELRLISQCKLCEVGEYANKYEKFVVCLLHIPMRERFCVRLCAQPLDEPYQRKTFTRCHIS